MALSCDEESIQKLFQSRGATLYWENWNKLQTWYHSSMLPEMLECQLRIDGDVSKSMDSKTTRRKRRRRQRKKKKLRRKGDISSPLKNQPERSSSESICPEFLEFYKETLRHRETLKIEKEKKYKQVDETVEYGRDDEGPEPRPVPTTAPPSVQAGSLRTKGLKALYGSSALKIQSLETQLQAKFDENLIRCQPRLWPVIPLNL